MNTKDEAADRICAAINTAGPYELNAEGAAYVREWLDGSGRDHVDRGDILDSKSGEKLLGALCDAIFTAGPFLKEACLLAQSVSAGVKGQEIGPSIVYALGRVLSLSNTPFCNNDPPPRSA